MTTARDHSNYVKNIRTENCQNLITGFQVTVENVWDVFLRHSVDKHTFYVAYLT